MSKQFIKIPPLALTLTTVVRIMASIISRELEHVFLLSFEYSLVLL